MTTGIALARQEFEAQLAPGITCKSFVMRYVPGKNGSIQCFTIELQEPCGETREVIQRDGESHSAVLTRAAQEINRIR